MTMTTVSEEDGYDTASVPPQDEVVESDAVPGPDGPPANTNAPSPPKGHSVPASDTKGRVWLRYAPRQEGLSSCQSSTEV